MTVYTPNESLGKDKYMMLNLNCADTIMTSYNDVVIFKKMSKIFSFFDNLSTYKNVNNLLPCEYNSQYGGGPTPGLRCDEDISISAPIIHAVTNHRNVPSF